jgi:hypothetical protein
MAIHFIHRIQESRKSLVKGSKIEVGSEWYYNSNIAFSNELGTSAYTVYTSRTDWENAIAASMPSSWYDITTDTFSNPIASAQSITLDSGIVSTNSIPPTLPNAFNNNSVSGGVYNNATQAGTGNTASNTVTWQFPSANVWAFGADFISTNTDRLTLIGNFDGTGEQTILVNNTIGGPDGFLGIVGMAEFSSVVFSNNTTTVDGFSIDNASFATKHTVPESSAVVALAMFGGGLLLIKKGKRS